MLHHTFNLNVSFVFRIWYGYRVINARFYLHLSLTPTFYRIHQKWNTQKHRTTLAFWWMCIGWMANHNKMDYCIRAVGGSLISLFNLYYRGVLKSISRKVFIWHISTRDTQYSDTISTPKQRVCLDHTQHKNGVCARILLLFFSGYSFFFFSRVFFI